MSIPLRIRHRFYKSGVFDLRRRVLIKNFLLDHNVKHEPGEASNETPPEPNQRSPDVISADENDAGECSSTSADANNTNLESYSATVVESDIADSNGTSSSPQTVEVESLQLYDESHAIVRKPETLRIRKKVKRRLPLRKKKHDANASDMPASPICEGNSEPLEERQVDCKKYKLGKKDSMAHDAEIRHDCIDESAMELEASTLENSETTKLMGGVPTSRTFSSTSSTDVGLNSDEKTATESSVPNDRQKRKFSWKMPFKRLRCSDELVAEEPVNINKKPSSKVLLFKFLQSKSDSTNSSVSKKLKVSKKKKGIINFKQKKAVSRSISVQTELSFPSEIFQSDENRCDRENKRGRYDSISDSSFGENRYWLRSSSNESLRVLQPLNDQNAIRRNPISQRSKCFEFRQPFDSASDRSRLTRSMSIQEDRAMHVRVNACRRVKSVYVPNTVSENNFARQSQRQWNSNFPNRYERTVLLGRPCCSYATPRVTQVREKFISSIV